MENSAFAQSSVSPRAVGQVEQNVQMHCHDESAGLVVHRDHAILPNNTVWWQFNLQKHRGELHSLCQNRLWLTYLAWFL